MSTCLTVNDLAKTIAAMLYQEDAGAAYWVRVFRNLHTAGILRAQGYKGCGRTAACLYDDRGLLQAAIVATLMFRFRVEPGAVREMIPGIVSDLNANDELSSIDRLIAETCDWFVYTEIIADGPATVTHSTASPAREGRPLQSLGRIAVNVSAIARRLAEVRAI